MKKILLIITFLLFPILAFATEDIKSVKDIFPKAQDLKGGASSWIVSSVTSEKRDRCTLYENGYSYYSTKGEKILDIQRKNTYVVSARIFECDNLAEAIDIYKSLVEISTDYAIDDEIAPVPFGEQGILVALPSQDKKSQQADFYVTYLFRNFIVQVYSDDGFAQMDVSGLIESNIYKYLKAKGASYAVNRLNLLVETDDIIYREGLSFTGDNVTSIALQGLVLDSNNKKVPNAKITAVETQQITYSDKDGKFQFTVSSGDDGSAISMVKTIILPFEIDDKNLTLPTGFYPIEVTNDNATIFNGFLNVFVKENRVSGYLIDKAINKRFPVAGVIKGDNITLDANCTEDGATFNCRKIFKGVISSDNVIKGKALGVGSGDFIIDKNKYKVIKESFYLNDIGLSLKPITLENGKEIYNDESNLSFNLSNTNYLNLQTDKFLGDDLFYFKNAYLNFQILNNNIKNKAELILYQRDIDENGSISIEKITSLKTISSEDKGEIIVNISSQIRQPNKNGYFIGLVGDEEDSIIFNSNNIKLDLGYYRDAEYKPSNILSISLKTFNGKDIVSNKGNIEKDGNNDIVLALKISAKDRILETLEIIAEASTKRVWNTIAGDIYPAIAVVQNGDVLNNPDSTIKIPLSSENEVFDLHLYKGSLKEEEINKIIIKAIIDGKVYENSLILKRD